AAFVKGMCRLRKVLCLPLVQNVNAAPRSGLQSIGGMVAQRKKAVVLTILVAYGIGCRLFLPAVG
ncbi:MAG: hypothetical protein J6T92_05615, partial [Ottowia sp.]|nr:hypothetical protein [Ottowia sp.]